ALSGSLVPIHQGHISARPLLPAPRPQFRAGLQILGALPDARWAGRACRQDHHRLCGVIGPGGPGTANPANALVPLANSSSLALSFLLQRLKWPVPMSRWRTAKEIRNLLDEPVTRSSTTDALLDYLDHCKTESEVCEILTLVFLTSSV